MCAFQLYLTIRYRPSLLLMMQNHIFKCDRSGLRMLNVLCCIYLTLTKIKINNHKPNGTAHLMKTV